MGNVRDALRGIGMCGSREEGEGTGVRKGGREKERKSLARESEEFEDGSGDPGV
jgi:hypothetical protein